MNVCQHGAGHARRTGPATTALVVFFALLVLLLCVVGPAAAYVPGKLVWTRTTGTAAHERGFDAIAKAPNGQFYGVGWVGTGAPRAMTSWSSSTPPQARPSGPGPGTAEAAPAPTTGPTTPSATPRATSG